MDRIKSFFQTTILGGLLIVLPVGLLVAVLLWLFNFVTNLIQPLTNLILKKVSSPELIAELIVILLILLTCFMVGIFVKTSLGRIIYNSIEHNILNRLPGFKIIKETVTQFVGNNKSPFSTVALAQIFENKTLVTCFITDEHENGMVSVFVPTGPNPTSGFIYHLKKELVFPVKIPVEDAMRSVISCGAGSSKLINQLSTKES